MSGVVALVKGVKMFFMPYCSANLSDGWGRIYLRSIPFFSVQSNIVNLVDIWSPMTPELPKNDPTIIVWFLWSIWLRRNQIGRLFKIKIPFQQSSIGVLCLFLYGWDQKWPLSETFKCHSNREHKFYSI